MTYKRKSTTVVNVNIDLPPWEPQHSYEKRHLLDVSHRYAGRNHFQHYMSTKPINTLPFLSYTELMDEETFLPTSVLLPCKK